MCPYAKIARTRAMHGVRLLFVGHLRISRLSNPYVSYFLFMMASLCSSSGLSWKLFTDGFISLEQD